MLITVYIGNVEERVQKEQQNRTIRSILEEDIVYNKDNKTDDTTDYTYYDDVDNNTDTTAHDLDPPPRSAHQFMQPKSLVSFDNVYFWIVKLAASHSWCGFIFCLVCL